MELHSLPGTRPRYGIDHRDKRPVSLMLKPPEPVAFEIERQRRLLEIPANYGSDRLHITLQPIDDARHLSPLRMARLLRTLAAFVAESFDVRLRRLNGNTLRCGKTAALHRFQTGLVASLVEAGFDLPDYRFRPHLSLCYGALQQRNVAIPPICWRAKEFLLIKSIYGQGRHELLGRWSLHERQFSFDF